MFAEFIETYGTTIIGTIITAVLGFIGIAAKRMAQKWLDTAEKRRVAREVVTFVEQVYKSCHGEEKLNYALEAAREMLLDQGITFNELEMRVLIESFLGEMNKVFEEGDGNKNLEEPAEGPEEPTP